MSEDDKKRPGDTSATMPTVVHHKFVMPEEKPAHVAKTDPRREPSLAEPRRTPAGGTHTATTVPDGLNQISIIKALVERCLDKFENLDSKIGKFQTSVDDRFAAADERANRHATELGVVRDHVKRGSGRMAKYVEDVEKIQRRLDEQEHGSEVIREEQQRQSDHDMEHEARVAAEIISQRAKVQEQEDNVASIRSTVEGLASTHGEFIDELKLVKEQVEKLEETAKKTQEGLEKNVEETSALKIETEEIKTETKDQTTQLKVIATAVGKLTSAGVLFFQSPVVKLGFGAVSLLAVGVAAAVGSCQGSHQHQLEEQRYHQVIPSPPPAPAPAR